MHNIPKITIAIPTYNRARYLPEAIESALKQSYKNIEVIISDNASTDATSGLVKKYDDPRIRYYKQQSNIGQIKNWNFCLNQATGLYFLMLSDDDILEEDAIMRLFMSLYDSSASLSYSRVQFIDEHGNKTYLSPVHPGKESGENFIRNSLLHQRTIYPSATLHRTDIAQAGGGYLDIGTTTDLALRLIIAKSGLVVFDEKPLIQYRIHTQSLSMDLEPVIQSHKKFVEWCNNSECLLYEYGDMALGYYIKFLRKCMISEALRGNRKNTSTALTYLQDYQKNCLYPIVARILGIYPIRLLASVRRALLRNRIFK